MGTYSGDYVDSKASAHAAAVRYVLDCLHPMNDEGLYWTISYARNDPQRGLWELSTPTLYKLIGIIQNLAFSQKNGMRTNHGRDRFVPDICSANYGSQRQRKAAIDSVYHFLYLIKGKKKVDAALLHDMLRSLPCNKKTFVNCSLPVRSARVEALLKFMIASVENPYRDLSAYHPRGISTGYGGEIYINSEKLIELLERRHEDADRIITMFVDEGADLGVLEARLDTHLALDAGVL